MKLLLSRMGPDDDASLSLDSRRFPIRRALGITGRRWLFGLILTEAPVARYAIKATKADVLGRERVRTDALEAIPMRTWYDPKRDAGWPLLIVAVAAIMLAIWQAWGG